VKIAATSRSSGFGFALVSFLLVQQDYGADSLDITTPSGFGFALVSFLLAQGRHSACCGWSKKSAHYQ
jgi:hypothetical protein